MVLNYLSPSLKGSIYYLGYFQDDLNGARAIQEQVSCWQKTLLFGAKPMISKAHNGDFDRNYIGYNWNPYGLNLEVISFRDKSQLIVDNAHLFDNLLGLSMAEMVIEQIIYTNRSNNTERKNRDQLSTIGMQLDLNGVAPVSDSPTSSNGLRQRRAAEQKRVLEEIYKKPRPKSVSLC
jgi:hypothetical protein